MASDKIPIWSVTDLNTALKDLLENTFLPVRVLGEVSGLTCHRSGHAYLTLKDQKSQIRAVFFNGAAACAAQQIENGTQVEAFGRVGFYAARGECQLNVTELHPVGTGILQIKFDEMKKRLAAEGLFDPERKKPLPFIPRCIGIITSPDGAAIHDFLKVALQRFPPLRCRVFPAPVQGKGAERYLAQGVQFFNMVKAVDVILLTRGGGSMEDLWPFNEEVLARAIAASEKPVVSAVGHEIDTSISDLVADLRVPTPTAAAEALLPDYAGLKEALDTDSLRLRNSLQFAFERAESRLQRTVSSRALIRPAQLLLEKAQTIDMMVRDMERSLNAAVMQGENRLVRLKESLEKLNPAYILERGYSILLNKNGKAVMAPEDAPPGAPLTAVLSKGKLTLEVRAQERSEL